MSGELQHWRVDDVWGIEISNDGTVKDYVDGEWRIVEGEPAQRLLDDYRFALGESIADMAGVPKVAK